YCCWALKNLALNETNKKRIAASRAPQLIVEALRSYPNHAGIVEESCGCVRKLVWGNSENQNRIAADGGIEAVIAGMSAHVSKATVQQQCGLALGDLAWSNEANQARIGRAHPTHSGTQGGLAIGNLASLCAANRSGDLAIGNLASLCAANRKLVAQAGGIQAIIQSVRTNLQFPGVQEYGCWALRHLVLDPDCKAAALREGAAQAIRQGMQEYPNRAGGNAALKNLLSS
ncbi:armadillo-type protein, partial [Baffinella frigidus]